MLVFELVFFTFPALIILASILGVLFFRKWFVVPALTLVAFTIVTFTVFNKTFFLWVCIYTLLSIVMSLLTYFIKRVLLR